MRQGLPDPPSPAAPRRIRRRFHRGRLDWLRAPGTLDQLTGLRNRRALWNELHQRAAACAPGAPLAVVMADFDRLEEVNTRYDHAVGDAVLRAGAAVARAEAPSPRLVFRSGEDDLFLLTAGDEENGRELAERVRGRIAIENSNLPAVTISCGVAAFDAPVQPGVAVGRAQAALRAAKRAGGNRVALSTEAELTHWREESQDVTARRAALAMAVASLQARDSATADHSNDVVALCESIGKRLGLGGSQLDRLTAGAQLHDVGKVAIPTEILNKPGPLDATEWAIIREHTLIGERMLRSVPEMAAVAAIVRHSHECWDGTGYPDGLAGEEIPLGSRIILCADAFHAIRSDRPYRPGRTADEALAEICSWSGRQFNPRVVDALVSVARDVQRPGRATVALPQSRRLAALFTILVVGGGGSAYAASDDVRRAVDNAVRVFVPAAAPPPAHADIALRPLDEVSQIVPVARYSGSDFAQSAFAAPRSDGDAAARLAAPDPAPSDPVDIPRPDQVARVPGEEKAAATPPSAGDPASPPEDPPRSSWPGTPEPHPAAPPPQTVSKPKPELVSVTELATEEPATVEDESAVATDAELEPLPQLADVPAASPSELAPVAQLARNPARKPPARVEDEPIAAPPGHGKRDQDPGPATAPPAHGLIDKEPPARGKQDDTPAGGNPHDTPPGHTKRDDDREPASAPPAHGKTDEDPATPPGNAPEAPPAYGKPDDEPLNRPASDEAGGAPVSKSDRARGKEAGLVPAESAPTKTTGSDAVGPSILVPPETVPPPAPPVDPPAVVPAPDIVPDPPAHPGPHAATAKRSPRKGPASPPGEVPDRVARGPQATG